jgi:PAS domain S-box-containing protein
MNGSKLWADASLRQKVLAVAAIPFVPLILASMLVFTGAHRERIAREAVEHTFQVKAEIATVFTLLAEIETGARGYALSPHADTLQVLRGAAGRLPSHFTQLLALVADNPRQHEAVRRVMALNELRPIQELVDFDRDGGISLEPIVARSRATMRDIRTELARMLDHENELLGVRLDAARRAERDALIISITGVTAGIAGSLLAVVFLTRDMSRRLAALTARAASLGDGHRVTGATAEGDEIAQVQQALEDTSQLLREREQLIAAQMREVNAARAELSQFFDLSIDMLCIAGVDGRFRRVNPAWEGVLGWDAQTLVSQPFVDFVHPEDVERTIAETAALARGVDSVHFENRYRCKDGGYKWLSWKARADIELGVIYAAARDVTARRYSEQQLREAQEEAERANRAKSEFVSRMSHDMRTPLNAVLGFAQLLEAESLTVEQQESVQLISRGGRHLLSLIDEVLDIARIEAGQLSLSPEPVVLTEVVQHALELIAQLAATREITVALEQSRTRLIVQADRQRLNQLLLNLLSNAIKYNRRGGSVRVTFGEGSTPQRVRVLVTDTGFGIAPDKLKRLFTPFERLGAEATGIEGTGLGLAVSRGLAAAMGGELGVTSEVGHGSTFWLELAAATAEPSGDDVLPAAVAPVDRALSARVLYIEDNPSNVRLMQRILQRRSGVSLHSAPNGRIGLELAVTFAPDVIFLDLNLPDMHGREVLRELQLDERSRAVPVAVLSADATPSQTKALLADGAAAYLTKPLDVGKVLSTLDQLATRTTAPLAERIAEDQRASS